MEIINAKIDGLRSETSADVLTTNARVDVLTKHLDAAFDILSARMTTKWTTWGAAGSIAALILASVGLIVAVLQFGGDRFDGGIGAASVSVQQAEEARRLAITNGKNISDLTLNVSLVTTRIDGVVSKVDAFVASGQARDKRIDELIRAIYAREESNDNP